MKFDRYLASAVRHHEAGRLQQAWNDYQGALALQPRHADALHRCGLLALETGRHELAAELIERAIESASPRVPAAYLGNLALVLLRMGYADAAEESARKALALEPDASAWHNLLGNALNMQGRITEAADAWARAFEADPAAAGPLSNYGNALQNLGRIREAMAAHERAAAIGTYTDVAWDGYLLDLGFLEDPDPAFVRREHERWAAAWLQGLEAAKVRTAHDNPREPDRRLRLGLLSADFRQHSVAFFIEPLLRHLDRESFEVYCYASIEAADEMTSRLQKHRATWKNVSRMTDVQVADAIVRDRIDVLVELGGHTGGNRLRVLGYRPAPVQVTYMGYPFTTGLPACGYRLTDDVSDAPGLTDAHYTERLLRLPVPMWCFQPGAVDVPVAPPPRAKNGYVTFGSFNTYNKTNDAVLDAWSRILAQVPDARLLLKTRGLDDPLGQAGVRSRLAARGVEPGRVTLLGTDFRRTAHLARYGDVDIALDTFPYNGTTTTCEALWQGVPVVTLEGRMHVSRVGLALLGALGLGELVGRDVDDYVARAVALAGDPARAAGLREGMRARMAASPIGDQPAFAGHVGAALRAAWREWCAG